MTTLSLTSDAGTGSALAGIPPVMQPLQVASHGHSGGTGSSAGAAAIQVAAPIIAAPLAVAPAAPEAPVTAPERCSAGQPIGPWLLQRLQMLLAETRTQGQAGTATGGGSHAAGAARLSARTRKNDCIQKASTHVRPTVCAIMDSHTKVAFVVVPQS